ncbi:MAG: hypothetical protein F6K10_28535 [Moorea sp. SIO2B7]|nr:hypothetical protein [Moorena sp. SIO2B7]
MNTGSSIPNAGELGDRLLAPFALHQSFSEKNSVSLDSQSSQAIAKCSHLKWLFFLFYPP